MVFILLVTGAVICSAAPAFISETSMVSERADETPKRFLIITFALSVAAVALWFLSFLEERGILDWSAVGSYLLWGIVGVIAVSVFTAGLILLITRGLAYFGVYPQSRSARVDA